MKIRKALERAKSERKSLLLKSSDQGKALETKKEGQESEYQYQKLSDLSVKDRTKGVKWNPPKYTESKIVKLDTYKLKKNRCIGVFSDIPETVAYKILRAQLLHRIREKDVNTVMVTSALPGEGKTLTSINLALTLAKEFNQTVLLVDSDLKHQNVHKYLGFSNDAGLISYLDNGHMLKDIIIWPGIPKLTIISGGQDINDSSEYLGSPKMKELVTEFKTRYDDRYVIFDTPPILAGADAITLAQLVDSIVMVVEAGRTSINDVKKALEMIPQEKFLGYVLNRHKSRLAKLAYEYKGFKT